MVQTLDVNGRKYEIGRFQFTDLLSFTGQLFSSMQRPATLVMGALSGRVSQIETALVAGIGEAMALVGTAEFASLLRQVGTVTTAYRDGSAVPLRDTELFNLHFGDYPEDLFPVFAEVIRVNVGPFLSGARNINVTPSKSLASYVQDTWLNIQMVKAVTQSRSHHATLKPTGLASAQ